MTNLAIQSHSISGVLSHVRNISGVISVNYRVI